MFKRNLKAPLPPSVVVVGDPPPASPCASPLLVTSASDSVAENQSDIESSIVSRFKSTFASFAAESLEARSSSLNQHFSQVISSFASTNSHSKIDVSCQDAITNCYSSQPQWPCVMCIRLIGLPPRRTPTTWEPP